MTSTTTRRELLGRGAAAGALGATAFLPPWMRFARPAAHARPRGVHLSFTADSATTTTATWFTDGLRDPGTVVEWGVVEPGMRRRDAERAPFDHIDSGEATQAPGVSVLTHKATMGELAPGQPVRYRVGRPGAWSPVRVFRPAPRPDGPWTFAHIGDHGTTADAQATTAFLRRERPDLVLVAGDLSYANGDQPVWDQWLGQLEPLAAKVPTMCAAGNHEDKDFGGETFRNRLAHPGGEAYYAFDVANVAFVVSTGGVFVDDGRLPAELAELERALASAALRRAAGAVDFVAVMQHYPLWTNHESRGPLNPALVVAEEQLLQRYAVDLLLVGHDHFYERSAPMVYGQVPSVPGVGRQGYVQVISGGGGKSLYDFVPEGAFQSWSAEHARRFHAVLYAVDGGTLTARAVATDGRREELDRFTLLRRPAASVAAVPPPRSAAAIMADLEDDMAAARRDARRRGVPLVSGHGHDHRH